MAEAAPQAFNAPQPAAPHKINMPAPPLPERYDFPTYLPTPPFIDIDGVPNFRDMGGYLTAASYFTTPSISSTNPTMTMVRRGLLYRCAHPQLLTPTGNDTLTQSLGVKHIFDLRSAPEIKKLSASIGRLADTDAPINPHSIALQPKGIQRHFTPVYEEQDSSPEVLARKLQWYTAAPSTHATANLNFPYSEGFVNAYRDIATHAIQPGKNSPAAYPTILRQIIDHPDEPIIFHCTAGKDRTGVLAALLLRLAGVDDDTIAWEYALTEPGLGGWRPLFIERIARGGMGNAGAKPGEVRGQANNGTTTDTSTNETSSGGDSHLQMSREEAARIVGSRAGNVRAFLKIVVDGEFGGVERYFTHMCGLSAEDVDKLRKILVVPVTKVEDVVPVRGITGWTPDGGVQEDVITQASAQTQGQGDNAAGSLPLNTSAGRETEQKVMTG